MNPCTWLAGGGGGGGGSGAGGGGSGDGSASAASDTGGNDPSGGEKKACGASEGTDGGACPNHHNSGVSGAVSKGDPVDVITGRVFTFAVTDVEFGGPLPLLIRRAYSSAARGRNAGFGPGWGHSLAWEIEERRRGVVVITHDGAEIPFGLPERGVGVVGEHGWIVSRHDTGFVLSRTDYVDLVFGEPISSGAHIRYRLTAIEDAAGNRITMSYRHDKLAEVSDCVGRVLKVIVGPDGNIAAFVGPDPIAGTSPVTLALFAYDGTGNLASATDADGYTTRFTYDDRNLMTSQTLPTGLTFFYRYDREGRCRETWGEHPGRQDPSLAAGVSEFLYDGRTRAKGIYHTKLEFYPDGYSEVDDSTTFERYTGNELGKCEKAVSGDGIFSRVFDANGHLLNFIDPLGHTLSWERDYRGRETRFTDALGRTSITRRNEDGSIAEVFDAAGGVTKVEQTRTSIEWVNPIGAVFAVKYGPRGLVEETSSPNGARKRYRHDAHGNLIAVEETNGIRVEASYDAWGRRIALRDADGATTSVGYSLGGRVLWVRDPNRAVTEYEYDGNGNVTLIRNANGHTTRLAYGGLNNLCEVARPDGGVVRLRYERDGNLCEVHNARGEVHSIRRNAAGLPTEERLFDGRVVRYRYDALGQLVESINTQGERTSYERDAAGQLVKRLYHDDSADRFEYDARGDVISASGPGGSVRFTRNAVGWIVREDQDTGDANEWVETDYDLMGRSIARRTSLGHSMSLARDERGLAARLTLDGEPIAFTFDAMGRELVRSLAAGGRVDSEYDVMGSLTRRRVRSSGQHTGVAAGEPEWLGEATLPSSMHRAYRYTAMSELAEVWDQTRGVTRFEYDPLRRLLAKIPEQAQGELFSYDPNGNLSTSTSPRVYGPGDRLLRHDGEELMWDAEGRLSERRSTAADGTLAVTRYHWSTNGLLAAVEGADGTLCEFKYDPWARRLSKVLSKIDTNGERLPLAATRFVWDGMKLVHEVNRDEASGATNTRTYVFETMRSVPYAHRDVRTVGKESTPGEWVHYLNDDSGAPEALITSSGELSTVLGWNAWGEVRFEESSSVTTPLRFRGQYADIETGLHYNRHRYYDPRLGRFISPDPIGLLGGLNPFVYADNCPTSAIDVDGLITILSVVKDKDGNVVASATNKGAIGGSFDTGKPCAEMVVLSDMSKKLGGDEAVIKKFNEDGHTIETYKVDNPADVGKTVKAIEKGKALPSGVTPVNPCGRCGKNFLEKSKIADQVLAPNKKKDGSIKKWDQSSKWGSD